MNDTEKNLFGWEMRLMQLNNDIYSLEEKRKNAEDMIQYWKEKKAGKELVEWNLNVNTATEERKIK